MQNRVPKIIFQMFFHTKETFPAKLFFIDGEIKISLMGLNQNIINIKILINTFSLRRMK